MLKPAPLLAFSLLLLFVSACSRLPPSDTNRDALQTDQPSPNINLPLTEADVPRMTVEEAQAALNDGAAIVVDVRSRETYKMSHIPGALHIALGEFETRPEKLKLPKDQWIITYCTWLSEHSSARAAFILLHNGYTKVSALLGGFAAWKDAGYPVEP